MSSALSESLELHCNKFLYSQSSQPTRTSSLDRLKTVVTTKVNLLCFFLTALTDNSGLLSKNVIKRLSGRNDISVQIVDQAEYERGSSTELVLTVEQDGTITPLNHKYHRVIQFEE